MLLIKNGYIGNIYLAAASGLTGRVLKRSFNYITPRFIEITNVSNRCQMGLSNTNKYVFKIFRFVRLQNHFYTVYNSILNGILKPPLFTYLLFTYNG